LTATTATEREELLERLLLKESIEEFFATEYDLLDRRELSEWLTLFADDAVYTVPLQRNVKHGSGESESRLGALDTAWFADTKDTLLQRVEQIQTGVHWAEEPVSRSAHLVTNVRVVERSPESGPAQTVSTRCRILVYRNRLEREVDLFVGIREDTLRRRGAGWEIVERTVFLEQNVLLAKNLTLFF
jgi:3-phenylpropionate/cinnamic acid dioxygenase small subunit